MNYRAVDHMGLQCDKGALEQTSLRRRHKAGASQELESKSRPAPIGFGALFAFMFLKKLFEERTRETRQAPLAQGVGFHKNTRNLPHLPEEPIEENDPQVRPAA